MVNAPVTGQQKRQIVAAVLTAVGLAFMVIAIIIEGLLRWVVFAIAVGILLYASFLAGQHKKPGNT